MFGWFRSKSLDRHLRAKRKVKANGVEFIIKRIDTSDYLDGSKTLFQVYDTYQVDSGKQKDAPSMKKVKEHMSHVILSGVVSPQVGRKVGEGIVSIDELFLDWTLVEELYYKILEHTLGKKKLSKNFRGKGA